MSTTTVDLRSQTSLAATILATAMAIAVAIRAPRKKVNRLFALFALSVALWYLGEFLARRPWHQTLSFQRAHSFFGVALPIAGLLFFRAFFRVDTQWALRFGRIAATGFVCMTVLLFTPIHRTLTWGVLILAYVATVLGGSLGLVVRSIQAAKSRMDRERLRYLALVGSFAGLFSFAEYFQFLVPNLPPVGTIFFLVFLYVLAQSVLSSRVTDLYDILGKLILVTALSFSIVGIEWILAALDPGNFFLPSVVAAIVLLLLFDPLQAKVEERVAQVFFSERYDFEQMALRLRHVLTLPHSVAEIGSEIIREFGGLRRITDSAVYFRDVDLRGFSLSAFSGLEPPVYLDEVRYAKLLERLKSGEAVAIERVELELEDARSSGNRKSEIELIAILELLSELRTSLCLGIGAEDVFGLILVRDERIREAFSFEEEELLRGVASVTASAVDNSRLYQQRAERERLLLLGEMSAGLAHEIRNPLGAIKASAQFLAEGTQEKDQANGAQREFLSIIVDEVDRLNRVVSSFLDYARPSGLREVPTDVDGLIQRTLQLLAPTLGDKVRLETDFASAHSADMLTPNIDPERLRQVLINLVQNAIQSLETDSKNSEPTIRIITRPVVVRRRAEPVNPVFEIRIEDNGPGLPERVRRNLFVPFVTTRERGTGLGLAISQRLVTNMGGTIGVQPARVRGTVFILRFPLASAVAPDTDVTGEMHVVPREP